MSDADSEHKRMIAELEDCWHDTIETVKRLQARPAPAVQPGTKVVPIYWLCHECGARNPPAMLVCGCCGDARPRPRLVNVTAPRGPVTNG